LTVQISPPGEGLTLADAGCESLYGFIPKASKADGDGCIRFTYTNCESIADASIPEIRLCDTPIVILSVTR
jgi:hypothetical protein